MIKVVHRKRERAYLLALLVAILILTAINDSILIVDYILLPFGFFIFLVGQAIFLAKRFANSLTSVENLASELSATNEI